MTYQKRTTSRMSSGRGGERSGGRTMSRRSSENFGGGPSARAIRYQLPPDSKIDYKPGALSQAFDGQANLCWVWDNKPRAGEVYFENSGRRDRW